MNLAKVFLFCAVSAGSAMSCAHAQNYQNIAPQVPPTNEPEIKEPPSPEPKQTKKVTVIKELQGIKLVPNAQFIVRKGLSMTGVSRDGLPFLDKNPGLADKLNPFIGKPLTLIGMQAVSKTIVDFYRAHDRPFVDVVFPEQDVTKGTLQVIVMEFRLGNIKVVGNKWFTDDDVREGFRMQTGNDVDYATLREDLAWINENPFRSINAVFAKGKDSGTTDLNLETQDRFPMRVYAGYDNTGTPDIGRSRYNLGFNWGNAFWANQQLSYQFTSSSDFWVEHGNFFGNPAAASFMAHSIDDVIPLAWHDKIEVFGAYTRENPQMGDLFNQAGFSGEASFRYIHPLPPLGPLTQEVQVGYDYKTSNNNLEFGGQQVFTSSTNIDQFLLIYGGNEQDVFGETTFKNTFVASPGGLTAGNTSDAFQQSGVTYATSDYLYDNFKFTRTTPFWWSMSTITRFVGQLSSNNLLPSEDLSNGGENSVRGYDEEEAVASEGVLFSEELRSPSFSPLKDYLHSEYQDTMQGLIFFDYGDVWNNRQIPGQFNDAVLASAGIGFRYALGTNLSINTDYGWQLRKAPTEANLGSLIHIAVTASY